MKKIDKTVKNETLYILYFSVILSVLMNAVFLVLHSWSFNVLFGNILGLFISVSNFFLMGISVQKALGKDEKEARDIMKLSQRMRFLGIIVFVVLGVVLPIFNTISVIVPIIFPRIAIMLRGFLGKKD